MLLLRKLREGKVSGSSKLPVKQCPTGGEVRCLTCPPVSLALCRNGYGPDCKSGVCGFDSRQRLQFDNRLPVVYRIGHSDFHSEDLGSNPCRETKMKKCCRCGEKKLLSEFGRNTRKPDGLQSWCSDCNKAYNRAHYQRHKPEYRGKLTERRLRMRAWFSAIKSGLRCAICGEDHPATLDFHHDGGDKEFILADAIRHGYGKVRILKEIKKCVVMCANCHRKHHHDDE